MRLALRLRFSAGSVNTVAKLDGAGSVKSTPGFEAGSRGAAGEEDRQALPKRLDRPTAVSAGGEVAGALPAVVLQPERPRSGVRRVRRDTRPTPV